MSSRERQQPAAAAKAAALRGDALMTDITSVLRPVSSSFDDQRQALVDLVGHEVHSFQQLLIEAQASQSKQPAEEKKHKAPPRAPRPVAASSSSLSSDLSDTVIDVDSGHMLLKALAEAGHQEYMIKRADHTRLSEMLLSEDPAVASQARTQLAAASRDIPEIQASLIASQMLQAGQFNGRVYPACRRGDKCEFNRPGIGGQQPFVGVAMLPASEWALVMAGRADVHTTNVCHFCYSVAHCAVVQRLHSGHSEPPTSCDALAMIAQQPYRVAIGGDEGFKEDFVTRPDTDDMRGLNLTLPDHDAKEEQLVPVDKDGAAKFGNPRPPMNPHTNMIISMHPFPRMHRMAMRQFTDEHGQIRVDISAMRSQIAAMSVDSAKVDHMSCYERALDRLQSVWRSQVVYSDVPSVVAAVAMSCKDADPELWRLLQVPVVCQRETYESLESIMPTSVLTDLLRADATQLDAELEWRRMLEAHRTNKRLTSFVRWCRLIHHLARVEEEWLIDAVYFLLDAQWLDVLSLLPIVYHMPELSFASTTCGVHEWAPIPKAYQPMLSAVPLHFSQLPRPGFIPDAMLRRTDGLDPLRYLWEKMRWQTSVMRAMGVKAVEAVENRPFYRRYLSMVMAIALLNGTGGYTPRPMPAPQNTKPTKRTAAKMRVPGEVPRVEDVQIRAAMLRIKTRPDPDHERSLAHRAMVYRMFYATRNDVCQPSNRLTVFEWLANANQYILITALRCIMLNYCYAFPSFDWCMSEVVDQADAVRHAREQLGLSRAQTFAAWSLNQGRVPECRVWQQQARQRARDPWWWSHMCEQVRGKSASEAARLLTMQLIKGKTAMNTYNRAGPRSAFTRTCVATFLFEEMTRTQDPMFHLDISDRGKFEAQIAAMPLHERLGYDGAYTTALLQAADDASTHPCPDGALFRFMRDVAKAPPGVLAQMARAKFQQQTTNPMRAKLHVIYKSKEHRRYYELARAFSVLVYRARSLLTVAPLPAHIRRAQLRAHADRMLKFGFRLDPGDIMSKGVVVYYCEVCLAIQSGVRGVFDQDVETGLQTGCLESKDVDAMIVDNKSQIFKTHKAVFDDHVGTEGAFDPLTSELLCCGRETIDGKTCGQQPLLPLNLLGYLVSANLHGHGQYITLCPQPGCGVPSIVSLNGPFNEHSFSCSSCILRRAGSRVSESDDETEKKEEKEKCAICRRILADSVVWLLYGWKVCRGHQRLFDRILEQLMPYERKEPTPDALYRAFVTVVTTDKKARRSRASVAVLEGRR